jgi:hypothetical protein
MKKCGVLWAMMVGLGLFCLIPLLRAQHPMDEMASGETEMIGKPAPDWKPRGWVNSPPVEIDQWSGRVILLRFFGEQPVAAPAVRLFYKTYHPQGLEVVAFYTPEPMPTDTDSSYVHRLATSLGFNFPVANDSRWETLNRYWLERPDATPDGMTFLIDRKGIIRYIQPDGRYEKASKDRVARQEYDKIEKEIQTLLSEPPPDSDKDGSTPAADPASADKGGK